MFKKLARFIFYGNYFYGCCTVALAVEANIQQNLPLNSVWFYLLLYFGTVIFYTYAYIQEKKTSYVNNRSRWYGENKNLITSTQLILIIISAVIAIYLLIRYYAQLFEIRLIQVAALSIIGIIALAYYGISFGSVLKFNTRNTGLFKPFVIGLVWATAVTYVPLLWYQVENHVHYNFTQLNLWYFLKNFMYISLLAILFDIKDYAADHNKKLKTFVVRIGIRKTIFIIIIPLTIIGFLSLLTFAFLMHFHPLRILINSIPFVLLIIVAWSMQRRKPIIYYLAVIDGLMLVKALCGILATLLVK